MIVNVTEHFFLWLLAFGFPILWNTCLCLLFTFPLSWAFLLFICRQSLFCVCVRNVCKVNVMTKFFYLAFLLSSSIFWCTEILSFHVSSSLFMVTTICELGKNPYGSVFLYSWIKFYSLFLIFRFVIYLALFLYMVWGNSPAF